MRLNLFFFSCYRVHRGLHSFPTRRSSDLYRAFETWIHAGDIAVAIGRERPALPDAAFAVMAKASMRSEEHTSELQSQSNLVCRLLLEKKKTNIRKTKTKNQPTTSDCNIKY